MCFALVLVRRHLEMFAITYALKRRFKLTRNIGKRFFMYLQHVLLRTNSRVSVFIICCCRVYYDNDAVMTYSINKHEGGRCWED